MSGVAYSLSFYDLLQYPLFKMAAKQDDKGLMKEIFYQAGMDTNEPFEIVEVLHRPATNKEPWIGLRVHGMERLDRAWLSSNYASYEAKIHTNDPFLRETLKSLDPTKMKRDVVSDFEDDEVEAVN